MEIKRYTSNKYLTQYLIEKYKGIGVTTKIHGSKYICGIIIDNYYYPLYNTLCNQKPFFMYRYFLPIKAESITYASVSNDILTIRTQHTKKGNSIIFQLENNCEKYENDLRNKICKVYNYNRFLIDMLLKSSKNRLIFDYGNSISGILINNMFYKFAPHEITKLSNIPIQLNIKEVFPKIALKNVYSITIVDYNKRISELNVICMCTQKNNCLDTIRTKIQYEFQTNK